MARDLTPRTAAELNHRRTRTTKTCPDCGKQFAALKVQTYCSPKCRLRAHIKRGR